MSYSLRIQRRAALPKLEHSNFSLPQIDREGTNMGYMNSWNSFIKERLLCSAAKSPSQLQKQESKDAPVEFPSRTELPYKA